MCALVHIHIARDVSECLIGCEFSGLEKSGASSLVQASPRLFNTRHLEQEDFTDCLSCQEVKKLCMLNGF